MKDHTFCLLSFKTTTYNQFTLLGTKLLIDSQSRRYRSQEVDRNIQGVEVRYLYGTANRLKTCFYNCSTKIKMYSILHILLVYVCMSIKE